MKSTLLLLFLLPTLSYSQITSPLKKCINSDWQKVSGFQAKLVGNADGDTIRIHVKGADMSIRLLGIDTAETNYQGKSQGYWGEKAKARLKNLIPVGTTVYVELDQEKCDFYQRMLGYVYVVSGKKLTPIHDILLHEGLAINYCIAPNMKRCEQYAKVVAASKKAKTGVHNDPNFEIPYEWRKRVSNRPNDRYPGDLFSKVVFKDKDAVSKIALERRVFFSRIADVPKDYRWIQ